METHNILSGQQFGFRKNHSTLHPMIHLNNFISKAFDRKEHVLAIFCDLRKAFDTVNHKILLKKLFRYGVRGQELNWFSSYLSNRNQFVSINGVCSSNKIISIGVPQGSILGPLLFILYINDLPECSKLFTLLFADDPTLLESGPDPAELFNKVNNEFKKITTYFRKNLLSLHPLKTKYIFFSSNRNAQTFNGTILINDNNPNDLQNPSKICQIKRVSGDQDDLAVRFLGLYVDPYLNFNYHTKLISKKISSALYFMRSAKNFINPKALTALYYSLIHSHLIYAIHIWSTYSQKMLNSSKTSHKNYTQSCLQSTYRTIFQKK